MGCVDGKEVISIKYKGNEYKDISFKDAWDMVSKDKEIKVSGYSRYCDTDGEIEIYDTTSHGYVNCKKFIRNEDRGDWIEMKFNSGLKLLLTSDHPLHEKIKGRVYARDLKVGDKIEVVDGLGTKYVDIESKVEIGYRGEYSYDVETESDRFDVSGIASHNCRTRVIGNVYDPSRQIVTGRGNLSFTSINLPRLAIKAANGKIGKGDIGKFYSLLDDMMELVHRQLYERYLVQCRKHPRNYPFLMGQGIWIDSDKLNKDDDISEVLKQGSLSVGSR